MVRLTPRAPLIVAMFLVPACGYSARFGECTVVCTPQSGCPDGLSCSFTSSMLEGLCETVTSDSCAVTLGISFAPAVDVDTGTDPTTAAIADLDGDRKLDLAVVNYVSGGVSLLSNRTAPGANQPDFVPTGNAPTASGPLAIAIADLNGDGKPDIAIGNQIDATVSVFLNTTTSPQQPSFGTRVDFPTGTGVPSIAVGDIDGDGKLDLVVTNSHSGTLSVLINMTDTGATTPTFATGMQMTIGATDSGLSVACADINSDGRPDVLVADNGGQVISVLVNATAANAVSPSFEPVLMLPAPSGPAVIAIGDLNDDSKPDLAIANYDIGTVSVRFNTTPAAGTMASFGDAVDFTTGEGIPSLTIADMNGDGRPDIAVAHDSAIAMLVNTTSTGGSTPSFAAETDLVTPAGNGSLMVGDLNADGQPDLGVVIGAGNVVALLVAK